MSVTTTTVISARRFSSCALKVWNSLPNNVRSASSVPTCHVHPSMSVFRGCLKMLISSSICFLTVAECPSYTPVHRRWSDLPCCCCPYLEQSAPTCHVRTLYVCFPRSPQGFPLQAFLPVTFTATFLVPAQCLNHSFYSLSMDTKQKYYHDGWVAAGEQNSSPLIC